MAKITDVVSELARPIAEAAGCTLWDVEYVKEAGTWCLRVYIDKEGGTDIDSCVAVSEQLSEKLDELDPIPNSYTLEVSSAGIDRALRRPEHFASCMGEQVDVHLYRPIDGSKLITGTLTGYEDGAVTLDGTKQFNKKDVAQVRLHVTF